jgi:hypothetical protein
LEAARPTCWLPRLAPAVHIFGQKNFDANSLTRNSLLTEPARTHMKIQISLVLLVCTFLKKDGALFCCSVLVATALIWSKKRQERVAISRIYLSFAFPLRFSFVSLELVAFEYSTPIGSFVHNHKVLIIYLSCTFKKLSSTASSRTLIVQLLKGKHQ